MLNVILLLVGILGTFGGGFFFVKAFLKDRDNRVELAAFEKFRMQVAKRNNVYYRKQQKKIDLAMDKHDRQLQIQEAQNALDFDRTNQEISVALAKIENALNQREKLDGQ